VDNATLRRFYSLHFLVPFIIRALVVLHLFFLHQVGSSNPLGLRLRRDKIPFHPYFRLKDLLGALMVIITYFYICSFEP